MSGLSVTPFASMASVGAGLAHQVEARAHHLRLAAQAIGVLDAVVAEAVRFADGAAGKQRAERRRDLASGRAWPRSAWMRVVERAVGAFRGVGGERAGDERGLEDALRLEQAGERKRGRNLRAVEEREPFLRAERQRLQVVAVEAPRRRPPSRLRAALRRRRSGAPRDGRAARGRRRRRRSPATG